MEKNIKWWKKSLIYQVYPLSFKDSNNDGIGDINGVTSKLDYLKELGVDVIWLSPVYESPMDDNGYDISNYTSINPIFGTMTDMDNLINEVHNRGMKLIMDLVVNHTSDEHIWFKEARKSKDNPYRDYYIWNDQQTPNIGSIFSGSAWEFDETTNQYFFHLFSKRQPDLNWENEEVRTKIYEMINWWLDKGIDGFRMDVIELIGKKVSKGQLGDGPFLEKHLSEMYEKCFKNRDIMTVGEMGGISVNRAWELTSDSNLGMNMTFQFSHMNIDAKENMMKWHIIKPELHKLKEIFISNQEIFKSSGWNALFLSNHDQPRQVTRFGNDTKYRLESAKMLNTMLFLQQGTPFLYQGEELGMTGIRFEDINKYKDVETINWYKEAIALGWKHEDIMASIYAKGRDNSRTPMQWDSSDYAGFSNVKPWLDVNPNYTKINAENEINDSNSIYTHTKKLIHLRKEYDVFTTGDFNPLDINDNETFNYIRKDKEVEILVINNLMDKEIVRDLKKYSNYKLLLSNMDINLNENTVLKPYASAVYIKEN